MPSNVQSIPQRGESKTAHNPIKVVPAPAAPKPEWIRVRLPGSKTFREVKRVLREQNLHTVCEEASCPNISECFSKGTATFMILGKLCTRRYPFCDVAHGTPAAPDPEEPLYLAKAIARLELKYVVITSVDRDDLSDGGAAHFAECIRQVRVHAPRTHIEVLVPDFRGCLPVALDALCSSPPDVLNHNLETVPRLYRKVRPGADYRHSLALLQLFKQRHPSALTKSGLMLGLGETDEEVLAVMRDLRWHHVDMLTIGQYLQPHPENLPIDRYVSPDEFRAYQNMADAMGFLSAACGPLVRSSYNAENQAYVAGIE